MPNPALTTDEPLVLERYAAICAEIDAGAPAKPLLEREGVTPEAWARAQAHWLKRMAAEIEGRRFPVTTRYQALFKAKRGVAEARLRAARIERPKPAEPVSTVVEAAAAEMARPIESPLASISVPEPPRLMTEAPVMPTYVAQPREGVAAQPPAMLPRPIAPAVVAAPVVAAPPPVVVPRALAQPTGYDDLDNTGRTSMVDIGELLKKHVMPFQPDDEDDESPRTGILDTTALLARAALPFPADNQARKDDVARHGTAPPPPPAVDLGATMMQASPIGPDRQALPFRADGRTPSSPGLPAVQVPGSSGAALPFGKSLPAAVPALPTAQPGQKLSIAAFASLTAELAEQPGDAEPIRRKYGVSEAEHQDISRTFTHAFEQDAALRERYVAMVRQYRGYLQQAKR